MKDKAFKKFKPFKLFKTIARVFDGLNVLNGLNGLNGRACSARLFSARRDPVVPALTAAKHHDAPL